MKDTKKKYLYDNYTWPEIKEVVRRQPVVLLPIGSTEDHGHHMPLDTDNFLIGSICEEAAKRAPDDVLLMPQIPYGFEDHHMDFPGTITIKPQHLVDFVLDVTTSVAGHGFRKILIADGHGSNMPILDVVARRTILETEALCGVFIWPSLIGEVVSEMRESDFPGGMSHAGELETSVYLYLNSEAVYMEKASKEIGFAKSKFHWHDLTQASPLKMMNWWSRFSQTGVVGDPTLANADKGERFFEAVVSKLVELIKEFKSWEIKPRVDHHV